MVVGAMGLLVTFSRTAWLAVGVGAAIWFWSHRRQEQNPQPRVIYAMVALVALFFLWNYHELVLSRLIYLNSDVELRSLQERLRDAGLAARLIVQHPWLGVGAGYELIAARALDSDAATVHNVPLLVTAELGFLGALAWLWLAIAGLRTTPAVCAVWSAVLVVGLFDNTLWLLTGWHAAILFGVLAAYISVGESLLPDDGAGNTNPVRENT